MAAVGLAEHETAGARAVDSIEWIQRFVAVFGSPNTCNGTEICNWHKDHAHAFTFCCAKPMPDFARSDLIVLSAQGMAPPALSG